MYSLKFITRKPCFELLPNELGEVIARFSRSAFQLRDS